MNYEVSELQEKSQKRKVTVSEMRSVDEAGSAASAGTEGKAEEEA